MKKKLTTMIFLALAVCLCLSFIGVGNIGFAASAETETKTVASERLKNESKSVAFVGRSNESVHCG